MCTLHDLAWRSSFRFCRLFGQNSAKIDWILKLLLERQDEDTSKRIAVLLKKEQVKLVFSDSWHNDRIWKSPPEFLDLSSHPQWYVRSALTVYSHFYFISFYWFEKLHKINVLLSHIIHKQKDKLYHTFSDAHFLSIYFSSTIKSGIASNNANTTVQQQPRIVYQPILDYFLSIRL